MGRGKRDVFIKIASVAVCALLVISSLTLIIIPTDVKADDLTSEGKNLDYNFMWFNITENLSNVVYKYPPTEKIINGRLFGSWGDNYTANFLNNTMNEIGLENVTELPLGPITDYLHKSWHYTSKVDILDYNLTINQPGYPYSKRLPYNESFVWPSGCKNKICEYGYNICIYLGSYSFSWAFG